MKQHKQMYYFATKDVLPDLDDSDNLYRVLAFDGLNWQRVYYLSVNEGDYTHWMQCPKAPDENDVEF